MTSVLMRRGEEKQIYTQIKCPCKDRSREQNDAVIGQGTPRIAGNVPKLGKGKEVLFPIAFIGSMS